MGMTPSLKKISILGFTLLAFFGGGCRSTLEYHQPTELILNPKNPFDKTISMTKKDRFQAGQWLRLALTMTSVGDYVTAWRYCEYILEYYSDTLYAKEAMKVEDKIANYKRNKRREYMRDNPGFFMGM